MLRERHQNLKALQAFEAVSRLQSISRAADELGVSQSAVSHHLRALSEAVGERLLQKSGRGIVLTEAGKRLGSGLQAAFAEIDRSVARTVGSNRETLRVAVCSSFAPGWLIGRLSNFIAANPSIDLQLRMYAQDPELTDRVADAFVTTLPSEPGFVTLKLQTEVLVPVLAPCHHPFLPGKVPLITTDLEPERFGDDWKRYCAITGLDIGDFESPPWLQVSHFVLALEMARNGLGVALVPDFLAARDLAAGTLSLFGPGGVGTDEDYYFCIKHSRRAEPGLQALSQWFRSQVNGRYANA